MGTDATRSTKPRDFSTISPSARAILLVRSQTSLPYAREAAEILCGGDAVAKAALEIAMNESARLRKVHFEERARSIDDALTAIGATSVLELAAGYSFRGLARAETTAVAWLDVDLPDVIATKKDVRARLSTRELRGTYSLRPLDVLDEIAFLKAIREMPAGPFAIVNEGLLMYFDDAEKKRLVTTIRAALLERDGAWITADIYVPSERTIFCDERGKKFAEAHRIDEKKFASFDAAKNFFVENGFRIGARVPPARHANHARETWTLHANV